ncbi:MAG: AAA family ATPase [Deltaproteobacteria bacterium]|nr:AAA family ATPase [Deltaproteobacteria bacterium]
MKILWLRLRNLNSLQGEWCIDFTHQDYTADGIFALTGPTGSGKSTILDAISLALYGQTPRLGRISKSSNEIMSRQSGDCLAELVFSNGKGRFRCQWAQHRSRHKPGARLAEASHEISDDLTGQLIESRKSKVVARLTEISGLSPDQFSRAVLLAQGGFDLFLRSDAEQKSKVLEQITGTEIYSEISRRAFIRARDEGQKLKELTQALGAQDDFSPELCQTRKAELIVLQEQDLQLRNRLAELRKTLDCIRQSEELKLRLHELKEALEAAKQELFDFAPEQKKLTSALAALTLAEPYHELCQLRSQLRQNQQALGEQEAEQETAEEELAALAESLRQARTDLCGARKQLDEGSLLFGQIRRIEQELVRLREEEEEQEQNCEHARREKVILQDLREQLQEEQATLLREIHQAEEFPEADGLRGEMTATLPALFENLCETRRQLRVRLKESQALEQSAAQGLAAHQSVLSPLRECVSKTEEEIAEQKQALIKLRSERMTLLDGASLREKREELRQAQVLRARMERLEDLRGELTDGQPCFLCGAVEHPFCQPVSRVSEAANETEDLSRLIQTAESMEEGIEKSESRMRDLEQLFADSLKNMSCRESEVAKFQLMLQQARAQSGHLQLQLTHTEPEFRAVLRQVGIPEICDEQEERLRGDFFQKLKLREELWNSLEKKRKKLPLLQEQEQDCLLQKKQMETSWQIASSVLEKIRKSQADLLQVVKELREKAAPELATLCSDQAAERLQESFRYHEEHEASLRIEYEGKTKEIAAIKGAVSILQKQIKRQSEREGRLSCDLKSRMTTLGFMTETDYLASGMTAEEMSKVRETEALLMKKEHEIEVRIKETEKQQQSVQDSVRDLRSEDLLEEEAEKQQGQLETLQKQMTALSYELLRSEEEKKKRQKMEVRLTQQREEALQWDKLNRLIGSADGRKFRSFAQGLTFDCVITYANQQLRKISDRYQLLRDAEIPLELNVIDLFQGGEVRPIRNLSGGETFLISLALALGLSGMNSRNVRVDSLFLDEGFGTLDEDALESALQALADLRHEGKLIGVISHMDAIKERIPTRISVTPISGGRSKIAGPGVRELGQSLSDSDQ